MSQTRIKKFMADVLGITRLHERIDLLYELIETELSEEAKQGLWERSRVRWQNSKPNRDLTWGKELSGDNFISKVSSYEVFNSGKNILEVGAGYGRLLKSCLKLKIPFRRYVALDISPANVSYLHRHFPNVQVVLGDIEKVSFDMKFDVVFSSLTFKHFYPSFEKALQNIVGFANLDCMFFFDLIEGERKGFEADGVTYFHWYLKPEILEILSKIPLKFVAFDEVHHAFDCSRLLVVAKMSESLR